MLRISFDPNAELLDDQITFEPRYKLLSRFIAEDVQGTVGSADDYLADFRAVVAGTKPPIFGQGNAWLMDNDAKQARLQCAYTPESVELPTAWLIDAIEKWRDFLLTRRKR